MTAAVTEFAEKKKEVKGLIYRQGSGGKRDPKLSYRVE